MSKERIRLLGVVQELLRWSGERDFFGEIAGCLVGVRGVALLSFSFNVHTGCLSALNLIVIAPTQSEEELTGNFAANWGCLQSAGGPREGGLKDLKIKFIET